MTTKPSRFGQPELSGLRAFLQTARTGSTAAAARRLHVSQPAISSAVHRLEEIAGVQLFDRSSRPMQLTLAGRILRNRVQPLLEELDRVASELRGSLSEAELDLRIGFSDSFGGVISPLLLPGLAREVGSLTAYTSTTPKVVSKLLSDAVDVAVATKFPSENPKVTAVQAFCEHFLIAVPRSYEAPVETLADVERLTRALPVVRFNDDSLDAVQIERVLRQCGSHRGRFVSADTNLSVMSLVADHVGWTVIPPLGVWMAKEFLPGVRLARIAGIQAVRTFYAMFRDPAYAALTDGIVRSTRHILETVTIPAMREAQPLLAASVLITPL